jgi:integrase
LRPEYATRHFQALAQQSGLPAIRLHDLRHTNASLALEASVEMKVVSDRLGHSQISVTADLYTQVSRSLGNAPAEQIAGGLRAPSETVPTSSLPQAHKIDASEGGEADVHP